MCPVFEALDIGSTARPRPVSLRQPFLIKSAQRSPIKMAGALVFARVITGSAGGIRNAQFVHAAQLLVKHAFALGAHPSGARGMEGVLAVCAYPVFELLIGLDGVARVDLDAGDRGKLFRRDDLARRLASSTVHGHRWR